MHAFRCYIFAARIACDSGTTCSKCCSQNSGICITLHISWRNSLVSLYTEGDHIRCEKSTISYTCARICLLWNDTIDTNILSVEGSGSGLYAISIGTISFFVAADFGWTLKVISEFLCQYSSPCKIATKVCSYAVLTVVYFCLLGHLNSIKVKTASKIMKCLIINGNSSLLTIWKQSAYTQYEEF